MTRTIFLVATLAAMAAALPAHAQFEGVIEMKMTGTHGGGHAKIQISKAGSRSEVEINYAQGEHQGAMKFTTLAKAANPQVVYKIDDDNKAYSEMDLSHRAAARAPKTWTVKKAGRDTVAGYSCQHVTATDEKGEVVEVWTSREIASYETMKRSMPEHSGDDGLMKALKDAGADGFFCKMVHNERGGSMTLELVKVEKKSLPRETFEIPAGYTKRDAPGGMGHMPPEVAERMREQMKNMTPEQREMMMKAMKQQE